MEKATTKSILDLVYKISKETGENPLDVIKKACERGGIEIPGKVGFKIKANGNLGKIKIGNELYFKIENIEKLEDEKIYIFKCLKENGEYGDIYGKYITGVKGDFIILNDDEYIEYDDSLKVIGMLEEVHGELWLNKREGEHGEKKI